MSLNRNQARDYFRSGDLIGLGMEADALRRKLHPEGVVTYSLDHKIPWPHAISDDAASDDRHISSTGTPAASAAGKRAELSAELSEETLSEIAKAVETGRTGVVGVIFEGGSPAPDIRVCEQVLRTIRRRFPDISLNGLSAQEIKAAGQQSGLSIRDTLVRLLDAGLASVRSDGAGMLVHEEHPTAAEQFSTADWLNVHRTAHRLGMHTVAGLALESGLFDEFLDSLDQIRALQEETGGFAAFYLSNDRAKDRGQPDREPLTAVEYLKALAIARLYLAPIRNVQCSVQAQGLKVLQLSFRFGANDAGSVALKNSPGAATEEHLRHTIRGAGFKPVQRNALFTACYLN